VKLRRHVANPLHLLQEVSNSAMLGSAYQAKYGLVHSDTSLAEMTRHLPPPVLVCQPSKDTSEVLCEASDGHVLIDSPGEIWNYWDIAMGQ
jgi:hypothetical protein